ncbi:hypothetical protein BDZ88DRAFT_233760 [Geranomyces variabilis]|nr:hypothetical protein BDZ88DRAFT_233760 [Geranomyces variabilis]
MKPWINIWARRSRPVELSGILAWTFVRERACSQTTTGCPKLPVGLVAVVWSTAPSPNASIVVATSAMQSNRLLAAVRSTRTVIARISLNEFSGHQPCARRFPILRVAQRYSHDKICIDDRVGSPTLMGPQLAVDYEDGAGDGRQVWGREWDSDCATKPAKVSLHAEDYEGAEQPLR